MMLRVGLRMTFRCSLAHEDPGGQVVTTDVTVRGGEKEGRREEVLTD